LRNNGACQTKEQHNTSDFVFHGAPSPCHRGLDGGTHPSGKGRRGARLVIKFSRIVFEDIGGVAGNVSIIMSREP
jgi:hypothetical protein